MAADSKDTTADKDANGALPKVTLRGMTDEDRATIDSLDYEGTRNQLATIVEKLQHGGLTLEESMRYWQIGEALADRAQAYLEEVRKQLEQARRVQQSGEEHAGTQLCRRLRRRIRGRVPHGSGRGFVSSGEGPRRVPDRRRGHAVAAWQPNNQPTKGHTGGPSESLCRP